MPLAHAQTLRTATPGIQAISALAWSPNGGKLAVATPDRVLSLYDGATGERRDRFRTKPGESGAEGDSGGAHYAVRALAFSPDGTQLAVAQSDGWVFLYRLGAGWGDKKAISSRWGAGSAVTALAWHSTRPAEVFCGTADGCVQLGAAATTNRAAVLFQHPQTSAVVALVGPRDGSALVTVHADGSLHDLALGASPAIPAGAASLAQARQLLPAGEPLGGGVPHAAAWVRDALVAVCTSTCHVFFVDVATAEKLQSIDLQAACPGTRGLCCAAATPAGTALAVGAYGRIVLLEPREGDARGAAQWRVTGAKQVDNLHTLTALAWKPDATYLATASMTGALDLWKPPSKCSRHRGVFEFEHCSPDTLAVTTLATGRVFTIKTDASRPLGPLSVYHGRYLLARTPDTLVLADIATEAWSEVPWQQPPSGKEAFCFEHAGVALAHADGQLWAVEYGSGVPGACVRTNHLSAFLTSTLMRDEEPGALPAAHALRLLAYLEDAHTIRVTALAPPVPRGGGGGGAGGAPTPASARMGGEAVATVQHDARVDWLELSPSGGHLLFRDARARLFLGSLDTGAARELLAGCSYAQWVPGADVAVAQRGDSLAVWYSVRDPDRMVLTPIQGVVDTIERTPGATQVFVVEGDTRRGVFLDEALIGAGAAMEGQDFDAAADALDALPRTPDTDARWTALAEAALAAERLPAALRCYAALGDVPRTRYLGKVMKMAAREAAAGGAGKALGLPSAAPALSAAVKARLAALQGQWAVAEALLLAQGLVEQTLEMYQEAQRWDDAVRVAAAAHHPSASSLKHRRLEWLMATGQEERAGQVKEAEGDLVGAIALYLQAGAPGLAAAALTAPRPGGAAARVDAGLAEAVLGALGRTGLHARAGEVLERLGRPAEAVAAYRKGNAFRRAVDLARSCAPASVVTLEEEWGDWLAAGHQKEAAVPHYIEAGCTLKALEAALSCRQRGTAAGIVEHLPPDQAAPYWRQLAGIYGAAGALAEAEQCWLRGGAPAEAVAMHMRAGRWEAAQTVASTHLPRAEQQRVFAAAAREAEAQRRWQDAERGYLAAGLAADAAAMYRGSCQWRALLRVVAAHQPQELRQAHLAVARSLQAEGKLREAERHFSEAHEWRAAAAMWLDKESWEDALRVAKVYGGAAGAQQVALQAVAVLGVQAGGALLRRFGVVESAVDAAAEDGQWAQACALAEAAAPELLLQLRARQAAALVQRGEVQRAEASLVEAGQAQEAVDMYVRRQDWSSALRVAQQCDPESVESVHKAQVAALHTAGRHQEAEGVCLQAAHPEWAVDMYRADGMWAEALRLGQAHLGPAAMAQLQAEAPASGAALAGPQVGRPGGAAAGDTAAAVPVMETYASQEEWEQAHVASAGSSTPAAAAALAARHARWLLDTAAQQQEQQHQRQQQQQQGGTAAGAGTLNMVAAAGMAAGILARRGVTPDAAHLDVYRVVALTLLRAARTERSPEAEEQLREYLRSLVAQMEAAGGAAAPAQLRKADVDDACRLFAAAQLNASATRAADAGLRKLAALQLTALLRSVGVVAADRVFFEAGMAWKLAGSRTFAFLLLNRYLDVADALDEGHGGASASGLTAGPWVLSDVPGDFPLPLQHYTNEARREEARSFVLEVSLEQGPGGAVLPLVMCDHCGADVYAAALTCNTCGQKWPPCAVSGYPVAAVAKVVSMSGLPARRDEWNEWVGAFGHDPVTGSPAAPCC